MEIAILIAAAFVAFPVWKLANATHAATAELARIRAVLATTLFWRDTDISNIYLIEQHLTKISEILARNKG